MAQMERSEQEQRERIPTRIFPDADTACRELALEIATLIRNRAAAGKHTVLGLATGSTPVRLYRQLIRLHKEENLSFRTVHTFNLDEYYGLQPDHEQSYYRFMREQLFNHIDIPAEQVHIPDGTLPRHQIYAACSRYEAQITELGGIDLQILGIGRTGHIGFNEPGSGKDSPTRLVVLDTLTRRDAARDFLGEIHVPRHAITMGVGTILRARKVVLMAWGEAKASVVARAVEEPPSEALPASFLQHHPDVRFYLDAPASAHLTRVREPWRVGSVDWNESLTRQAVIWLAGHLGKPILKLTDEEYNEHGMADLLVAEGSAYDLNIRIFNHLQHTITGWPGGKPSADDAHRPERASPFPKRSIIFSPEPQDELLGMGGTLARLVKQGHEVTVVYATSGHLSVPHDEIRRGAELVSEWALMSQSLPDSVRGKLVVREVDAAPHGSDPTPAEIRDLKKSIRRSEARFACKTCGLEKQRLVFLDLPFYENGRYRQFEPGLEDETAIARILRTLQPDQIFTTGSVAEPSSLQAVVFRLLLRALDRLEAEPWRKQCRLWLWAGGAQEWPIHEIEMAVPLSPGELDGKIHGIYQHHTLRSQNPNRDGHFREAWQQAEAINQATAGIYNQLGLAEYEAMEAFRRWPLPPS